MTAPVRVLHIHTLPVWSGSGINTFLSMQLLPPRFAPAMACAPGGRLEQIVRAAGIPFYPIPAFTGPLAPLHDLCALLQLIALLRREHFAVVHTHNSKAGFLGRLAAMLCGVPCIVHTIHGFAFHQCESAWRRRLFIACERLAAHWCHALIAISQPMIDWAEQEQIAPGKTIDKIYSGIEVDAFANATPDPAIRTAAGWQSADLVVGFFAKLWSGKGHADALQALALARRTEPRLKLLLVGDGELCAPLEHLRTELALGSAVHFAGFREDIPALTAACDICILPSYFEGMGRVVLEGMASGKPVVASRVGGIVELIRDRETGLFITPGRPEELAAALLRLAADPALRIRLGAAARQAVSTEFSAQVMADRIVAVYDRLLNK